MEILVKYYIYNCLHSILCYIGVSVKSGYEQKKPPDFGRFCLWIFQLDTGQPSSWLEVGEIAKAVVSGHEL